MYVSHSVVVVVYIHIHLQELGLSDAIAAEVIASTPNDNKTSGEKASDKPEEQRIGPWVKRRVELLVKALVVEEQLEHHGELVQRKAKVSQSVSQSVINHSLAHSRTH